MSNTGMVDMYYANTLKMAGACAFLGMAVVLAPVSGAHAQPQFDKKLAKFLADKAAEALGDLRLGPLDTVAAVLPETTETFFGRTATDAIETGSIRSYQPLPAKPEAKDDGKTRWLTPRTDIRIVYAG
ncbi:MAG: hypothetical protein CL534_13550 [Ahrensia sp.]|nr:hypothetical protein [Ahrensia sp.]